MRCPNDETLTAYLDNLLPEGERRTTTAHLVACAYCSSRLAEIQRFLASLDERENRVPRDLLDLVKENPGRALERRSAAATEGAVAAAVTRPRGTRLSERLRELFSLPAGRYLRPVAAAAFLVTLAVVGTLYFRQQVSADHLYSMSLQDVTAASRLDDGDPLAVWPYTQPVPAESVAVRSGASADPERLQRAHGRLLEYLERRPEDARGHALLGRIYLLNGLPEAAREEYLRAVELAPGNPDWHVNLAVAYLETGYADRARTELETTLELAPRSAPAHFDLAVLHHREGRVAEARRHLERCLEVAEEGPVKRKAARWLQDLEEPRAR
jgi:tetratricopeptide (TPR) repeat protein